MQTRIVWACSSRTECIFLSLFPLLTFWNHLVITLEHLRAGVSSGVVVADVVAIGKLQSGRGGQLRFALLDPENSRGPWSTEFDGSKS